MTSEFPDRPRPRVGGDPADDPPLTVRTEGGEDWDTRYSRTARRAIKMDWPKRGGRPWVVVTGPGRFEVLSDHEIRDWYVTPPPIYQAAFAVNRASGEGLVQPASDPGRGDMDVEAFRG